MVNSWHAMKSKLKHDKHMPRNVNNDKYRIPRYKNHASMPNHDKWKPMYRNNTRCTALWFNNHAIRRTLLKPQPKSRKENMINKVRMLVYEYINVFNKL